LFGAIMAAAAGAADPAAEAWDLLASMAAALGRGAAAEFLAAFDAALPGYSALRANVNALVSAAEVESAVDPVRNDGDDRAREVEVDWSLHLVDRAGPQRVTRRRQNVKCRVEKRRGTWKVVALDPVSFFAPPSA
jgi:hypothetical protein